MNPSSRIAEITSSLNSIFKAYDEATSKGQCYGYSGIPSSLKEVKKYGIDKVFLVSKDYHGKYEDDYCDFIYWNESTKEFFNDYWTTAAACPSFNLYESMIDFKTAWEGGLIDKIAYLSKVKESVLSKIEASTFVCENPEDFQLRVEVTGGKKWHGVGHYVDSYENEYQYATPMFRNRYYGTPRDFGVSRTKIAIIYDPNTNTLNECNAKYLKFIDIELIMNSYKAWAKEIVEAASVDDIKIGSSTFDIKSDYSLKTFLGKWASEHKVDTSTASNPVKEEKERIEAEKKAAFKESKMKELIAWVRENTDKEGEDIVGLAEHIFNKKYNS